MFSAIRSMLGSVSVKELNGVITISGLSHQGLMTDIFNYWKTTKIGMYILTKKGSHSFEFNNFFAIEMLYMFEELRSFNRARLPLSVYNNVIKALQKDTWLRDLDIPHADIIDSSRISMFVKKPLEHQIGFFKLYNERIPKYNLRGYQLSMDMGTGKTLTALMTAEQLHCEHIIVVAPNRVLYKVWKLAFETEYKKPQSTWVSQDGKVFPLVKPPKGIIMHYESLVKYKDDIIKLAQTGKRIMLIVDESHSFNEITALRTQTLIELVTTCNFTSYLGLSGTPVKAIGSEILPLLYCVDPLMTEDTGYRFRKIFGKSATKGIDIAKHRMGLMSYSVSIKKQEPVEIEVPVKINDPKPFLLETIKKEMTDFIIERTEYYQKNYKKYAEIYDEAIEHFKRFASKKQLEELKNYEKQVGLIIANYDPATMVDIAKFCNDFENKVIYPTLPRPLNNEFKNAKSVVKYMELKIRGEVLGRILGAKRVEATCAMIPEIGLGDIIQNSEKKVVIFTSYVKAVNECVDYLKANGIPALYIHGENSKEVTNIVTEFDKNPKYKVLVATYASLSSGIPLVMANTMVFLNSAFRSYERQQAVGRILRINNDASVIEIYECVLDTGREHNISSRSLDIMKWSEAQVEAIMGKADEHLIEISFEGYDIEINL